MRRYNNFVITIVITLLLLAACQHRVQVQPPAPETLDQFLFRTEGVTCADITAHDEDAPIPDCHKLYEAFVRGRNRVAALYPQAAAFKMSALTFRQVAIMWNPGEAFPRMKTGAAAETLYTFISYAFEQTVEHETCHALVFLVDPGKMRTPEAIANPKDADQSMWRYRFQIVCHNTSDDPIGNGTSISVSGRAGCVEAYDGPPAP